MIGHDTYPWFRHSCSFSPTARLARTVIAGLPHHVTQRGNRREAIFFEDGIPCERASRGMRRIGRGLAYELTWPEG